MVFLAACGSPERAEQATAPQALAEHSATPSPAVVAAPDVAACPARQLLEEGLRQRARPIAVPAALDQVMRSDMDNFAFSTLGGGTVCIDASWMEAIHDARLSPDGRLASFGWDGYEAYGHVIVDRHGPGRELDTGVAPVFSPSGRRFAAADLGEAGYGALNAFAVWQIEPTAIRELGKQQEVPSAADWRIGRWTGESCVELSAIPWEGYSGEANAARQRFNASEAGKWRIEPGRCAGA